ncbi:hypothetical protein GCM10009646_90370 [Streptomyces aureus]
MAQQHAAKIRCLGEQAMATLKGWRLLRKLRCSINRITAITRLFSSFTTRQHEVEKGLNGRQYRAGPPAPGILRAGGCTVQHPARQAGGYVRHLQDWVSREENPLLVRGMAVLHDAAAPFISHLRELAGSVWKDRWGGITAMVRSGPSSRTSYVDHAVRQGSSPHRGHSCLSRRTGESLARHAR